MKSKAATKSAVPALVGGLGAVGASLLLGPIGLASFPLLWGLTRQRVAQDVDRVVREDAERIAREWLACSGDDESGIRVSRTVPFGGFGIPATREYTTGK